MTSTVTWLRIGNLDQLYPPPHPINQNIPAENAAELIGHTAFGVEELEFVSVTGTLNDGTGNNRFGTINSGAGASQFSYDRKDSPPVSSMNATSAFAGTIDITLGDDTVVTQFASVVQMANGDVFIRPHPTHVDSWDGITTLKGISVAGTGEGTATPYFVNINSTISFNASVFEIEIIPCFTHGTMIETAHGLRRVETLSAGDLIRTADADAPFKPIRWIGSRMLDAAALQANPKLRPIRIRAGALGGGLPGRDLVVSPQHRILVHSRIARNMFGADEVLVAARQLLAVEGIEIAGDVGQVEYVHFMFDNHEIVYAEGAATESLYAGQQALHMVGPAARQELLELFPEFTRIMAGEMTAPPARPFVNGKPARKLAERHSKGSRSLIELQRQQDMRLSA